MVTSLITLPILADAAMPGHEASPKNPSLKLSEPVLHNHVNFPELQRPDSHQHHSRIWGGLVFNSLRGTAFLHHCDAESCFCLLLLVASKRQCSEIWEHQDGVIETQWSQKSQGVWLFPEEGEVVGLGEGRWGAFLDTCQEVVIGPETGMCSGRNTRAG